MTGHSRLSPLPAALAVAMVLTLSGCPRGHVREDLALSDTKVIYAWREQALNPQGVGWTMYMPLVDLFLFPVDWFVSGAAAVQAGLSDELDLPAWALPASLLPMVSCASFLYESYLPGGHPLSFAEWSRSVDSPYELAAYLKRYELRTFGERTTEDERRWLRERWFAAQRDKPSAYVEYLRSVTRFVRGEAYPRRLRTIPASEFATVRLIGVEVPE